MGRTCKGGTRMFLHGAFMLGLILHSAVGLAAEVRGEMSPESAGLEMSSRRGGMGRKMFVTTGTGVSMLMGKYSPWVNWGQSFRMELGRTIGTKGLEGFVFLHSSIHNGSHFEEQGAAGCFENGSCIQGDTRFQKLGGGSRTRLVDATRIDVYGRVLGGVAITPLLMDNQAYEEEVVEEAWQGQRSSVHDQVHPFAGVGVYMDIGNFGTGIAPYLAVDSAYLLGVGLTTEVLAGFSYQFGQRTVSKAPKTPKTLKPKPPPKVKKAAPVEIPEDDDSDDDDAGDWRDW